MITREKANSPSYVTISITSLPGSDQPPTVPAVPVLFYHGFPPSATNFAAPKGYGILSPAKNIPQKAPGAAARDLTIRFAPPIMNIEKGTASKRLVRNLDQRMTVSLGAGRSFSFIDLDNQTYNANDDKTKSKKPFICNHKHHPPFREVTNRLPFRQCPFYFTMASPFLQQTSLRQKGPARVPQPKTHRKKVPGAAVRDLTIFPAPPIINIEKGTASKRLVRNLDQRMTVSLGAGRSFSFPERTGML